MTIAESLKLARAEERAKIRTNRRKANEKAFKEQRKAIGEVKRGKMKNPAYLSWLHTQKCAVPYCCSTGLRARIEAAHVGERGLGRKCSDLEAIPICFWHHSRDGGPYSHHNIGASFWVHHCIDRDELIQKYNNLYDLEKGVVK